MSRLIRDTDLIDCIEEIKSGLNGQYEDNIVNGTLETVEFIMKKLPTAYDVEAVVQKLEEMKMAEYDDSDEEPCYADVDDIYDEGVSDGKYKAYHTAIEIVKRGERNE